MKAFVLCAVLVVSDDPKLWREMVAKLGAPSSPPVANTAWPELIRSRVESWKDEIPALAEPYAPVVPPDAAIVIGNGGGQDAFTHDAHTIGFDVGRLQSEYGDADLAENRTRIDRFFRHEYTHLMQKAWLRNHPYDATTPLRAALLGIWTEGLGNAYSLSDKWRGADSAAARKARAELEPRFVARLAALACASDEDAERLMADLSMGRFDQKWGALPVALWLDGDRGATRALIEAGPDGIWALAEQHLPEGSRPVLRETRALAAMCH